MVSDYLSADEYISCVKYGAVKYASALDAADVVAQGSVKLAGKGMNQFIKALGGVATSTAKAVDSSLLLGSLVLGVPVGVMAHSVGREAEGKKFEEEKLRRKINMYRDAIEDLRRGAD